MPHPLNPKPHGVGKSDVGHTETVDVAFFGNKRWLVWPEIRMFQTVCIEDRAPHV